MPDFPALVDLYTLDGTDGFRINGAAAVDQAGISVASAGDINGDGVVDMIIGAWRAAPNGSGSGAAYVVFGSAGPRPAALELSALDGTNGFRMKGVATSDRAGVSVAAAGDFNGDGIGDLIVGASHVDENGSNSGASYIVFGRTTGFDAEFDLTTLNGANGFRIDGAAAADEAGRKVALAGDVNGDGRADLIIGASLADVNGGDAGAGYVVFGTDAVMAADFDVASLDGSNGFRILGAAAGDQAGYSVASAGDVNGDGIGDLLVGAYGSDTNGGDAGTTYVIYGKSTAFAADFSLAALDGANGFRIQGVAPGDNSAFSVAAGGDINGDGIGDLLIGAPAADPGGDGSGAGYVVFGRPAGFSADINLADLDGTNGFVINGLSAAARTGWSIAAAGDINGDGWSDVVIGAWSADAVYVVYGSDAGFAANFDLTTLDGTNGFQIAHNFGPSSWLGFSVAAAGDVNADGVDDLLIGGPATSPNGIQSGTSFVLFGRANQVAFVGTGADDDSRGSVLADSLSGQGGNDVLIGLAGNDLLDGGDLSDQLYGGDGADDLVGGNGGDLLYGEAGDDQLDGGQGGDKLFGGLGADQLTGGGGADRLAGEDGTDTLGGDAGNDYLDGGTGADILSGGADNDVYLVDDANDQTIELAGGGYDVVRSRIAWTLAGNVEALQLQGAADVDGTGNGEANNLQGNSGANRLDGGSGVDTLNGNDGEDIIVGGLGNDLLRGGLAADTFVVAHGFGPVLETDQIYDFSAAEGDIIDLSGAYAGTIDLVSGFTRAEGEMTLTFAGGVTTLRLDINGDGRVDYQMKINGDVTGESADWLL